jgi:hypothetical protein
MAAAFFAKVAQGIDEEMENEFTKFQSQNQKSQQDQQKLQELLLSADVLQKSINIRVTQLSRADIAIDKKNLHGEMESTMVLHSNLIEDTFQLKGLIEKMKVLLNGVVGILHHNLRFKNQFRLKSAKEMDTYIAQEPAYNAINVRIKELQNLVERSQEFAGMIKQKIGFIRDLTKMRTQEMFSEK